MKLKRNDKIVTSKNYIEVLIISVIIVIVSLLARSIYLSYEMTKLSNSVFNNQNINQVNTEDFDFALTEVNDAILYVGYTGDKEIHSMEKRLLKEIEKRKLSDKVIYWNISEFKNNEYLNILKERFSNIEDEITAVPMIIYIKDGEAVEAMSSELRMIDYKIFDKLVDKYEIE